jgi:hypothetical protein
MSQSHGFWFWNRQCSVAHLCSSIIRDTMAAVRSTEPSGTPIEAFFRPKTLFPRDSLRDRPPTHITEVELLPGLLFEDLLATGITWDVLCLFRDDKYVWMTPDVYVCSYLLSNAGDPLVLWLGDAGVRVVEGTPTAAATATCDLLLQLLATCELPSVYIDGNNTVPFPINGAALSLFFEESRENRRKVGLRSITLNEDVCRALGTMSRFDVEVNISCCRLSNDAAGAFHECLQNDRGPIELHCCEIDSRIIASALTGSSRVTMLKLDDSVDDAGKGVIFRALVNNRGLVDLDLGGHHINDDNWRSLCLSLRAHPTLASLDLRDTTSQRSSTSVRWACPTMSPVDVVRNKGTTRTPDIAEVMAENTSLQTIHLSERHYDQEIYLKEILPRLETNLHRPRVLAVKESIVRTVRQAVLGRALYSVRSSPNLVWMFLSENVDAFVRSEEESNSEGEGSISNS